MAEHIMIAKHIDHDFQQNKKIESENKWIWRGRERERVYEKVGVNKVKLNNFILFYSFHYILTLSLIQYYRQS